MNRGRPKSRGPRVEWRRRVRFLGRTAMPILCLLWLLSALRMVAQTGYGTIVGTVNDASGAAVSGAKVVLKNEGTGGTQELATGQGGSYTVVNLNPGNYTICFSGPGFESVARSHVDVQIGGFTRVDVVLHIGDIKQTLTVAGVEPDLHTDSATLDGVIEGQQVLEAPLNGRNVNNLLDFVPGVVPGGGTQGSTTANGGSGNFKAGGQTQPIAYGNYQIGGSFGGQSLFFIDGVQSNIAENNVNTVVLTQDAVQEFRVSTNNVSAEFGGYGGGVVQISSRTGSNAFRANVYEYFRNTALDANDWFSNHEALGRSVLHQNQYGLNVGGPVVRKRLFFFFSWEHESLISESPTSAVVPTRAELSGDFSADPQTIYDPATGQPFPGNRIPENRIDPTALRILELEIPAQSRVVQKPYTTNFFAPARIKGYQDQFNARMDADLKETDKLLARYTYWNPHNEPTDPYGTRTGSGPTGNYTQEGVLGSTHIFNSRTIADLRLSYLENYNFQYPLSEGFDMSTIGPAYGLIQSESQNKEGLLPGLSIQGYDIGALQSHLAWNNNAWSINGSTTRIVGRHTLKFGGNWRQLLWESYGNSQGIGLNATPFYTSSSAVDKIHGNALASFMLGILSSSGIQSNGTWRAFLHNYGLFANDTFQAASNLTITAGLHWEQPGSYSEENNLDTILRPHAPVTIGGLGSIRNPVSGEAVPLTGDLAFVASPQYHSRREENLHWDLFSPRVGFAYRIIPRTVLRSGYGISYYPAEITADSPDLSPINSAFTGITNPGPGNPLLTTVADPLPNGIHLPTGRTQAGLDAALGQGIIGRVPDQAYGYAQQWNFGIERSLGQRSAMSAAYAGAKGTHLVLSLTYTGTGFDLNQLPDQYHSLGPDLLKQVPNPFYGVLPAGTAMGTPTVAQGYLLLPHPQYPDGLSQAVPRIGASSYNALQATYVHRFEHDGIVQAAYTWAKLLSNTESTSAFQDGQGGIGVVQDHYNLHGERSISEQNIAHNLVINYALDLPIGRERRFLANADGFVNAVAGGWRINGITQFRSGVPLALVAANNVLSQFGAGRIRPNYARGCAKEGQSGSPHSDARAREWFNTSCFLQPDDFAFGDEPRVDPQLKSDALANFDVALSKSVALNEGMRLIVKAEIFDLFNHPQFALPILDLSSPSFGEVQNQRNLPRTIQLAMRVTF